jgi:putative endonuclease
MADHNELGKEGEKLALEYLKQIGYKVLHSNWRFQRLEVDIIAQTEGYLVFIEVKTRETNAFGKPESFVDKKQQGHLAEAVEAYMYKYPDLDLQIRYDVISIVMTKNRSELMHFEDAFWPDNLNTFSADV